MTRNYCFRDNKRLYNIYRNMKQRCHNPKAHQYKDYGERGIYVCDEWKNSFSSFVKWALNNGYEDGLTIDRINNNAGYCPNNCRFTTMLEQERNRRPMKHNKFGQRGVYYDETRDNWRATICVNYKQITLGRFPSFKEAKKARIDGETKYWREEQKVS